jgi:hypothetical protein
VFSFNGHKKGLNIIEEYDRRSLYPMLLKCYHYLHPILELEIECVDKIGDAKSDLDLFEKIPTTSELITKCLARKMLIFRSYQVDSMEIKHPLQWWGKHETMFFYY